MFVHVQHEVYSSFPYEQQTSCKTWCLDLFFMPYASSLISIYLSLMQRSANKEEVIMQVYIEYNSKFGCMFVRFMSDRCKYSNPKATIT